MRILGRRERRALSQAYRRFTAEAVYYLSPLSYQSLVNIFRLCLFSLSFFCLASLPSSFESDCIEYTCSTFQVAIMVPVEPISLTIGAVALASLFSLCVQCFDLIEVGRNLGLDYELLIVKLSIEKRRLMIWGEAVGILRPDQDRDQLLDEPETHQLVERILMNIQKIFHDANALQSKYGLEKASDEQAIPTVAIEGSVICSSLFENSPLAQFQKRVSGFHQKAGLMTKTRWAICDNSKFVRLITNLKDLLDGLHEITTSVRTSILKGHLIRQETESIADLRTLKIIEECCSDADWKSCASAASSYLNSIASIDFRKRNYIHEWMESDQEHELSPQIQLETELESWTQRHDSRPHERAASPVLIESRSRNTPKLQLLSKPGPFFPPSR